MHDQLYGGIKAETGALDAAIRAALGDVITGVSTGPYGVRVHFVAEPDEATLSSAQSVVDAHDPVFLQVNKTTITADGADEAVVTVTTPKAGAAAVTLDINGQAVAVDETGQVAIASLDAQTITVSVQNPANRSTQMITIKAV